MFTSMGFTLSSHYCGGKKVKSALSFGESNISCGMQPDKGCDNHKKQFKKKCCENHYLNIEVEEDYTPQSVDYNFDINFTSVFLLIVSKFVTPILSDEYNYNLHAPPLIVRNIPVLIQSFLI